MSAYHYAITRHHRDGTRVAYCVHCGATSTTTKHLPDVEAWQREHRGAA